jgi:sigma-B regulation protein RsbU (phosphoserine phosphatase)
VGQTTLAPGETLVAWTDGVTEAQATGTTELFGEERTLSVAEGTDGTAAELLDRLLAAVDAYAAGAEQADDVTLLAVRRHRAAD